jgi:hypothetical protein
MGPGPAGGVTLGGGALYGTTWLGGAQCILQGSAGCGIAFQLTPPARGQTVWTESVLSFGANANDGFNPYGLTIGDDSIYGSANGPQLGGSGLVFALAPPMPGRTAWTETVIYEGGNGGGIVTPGGRGVLFGLGGGGLYGLGTVFELKETH